MHIIRKNIALCFVLGALLLIAVIFSTFVEQRVSPISITLTILGVFLLIIYFIFNDKFNLKTFVKRRLTRLLKLATVTFGAIFFLAGANYFASNITHRWDLTQNKQHTLSQTSIDFIEGMKIVGEPIELIAFYVGLPPKYLEDLLNEYQRRSKGKITINIVDPINDIAYAAKYGNIINGEEKKLIVISGDERKDIDFSTTALNEEQITNALARVNRESRQACFLTGHGELSISKHDNQGFSLFTGLLKANNINSKSLMLGTAGVIPDDCDILVIAAPRVNLTTGEEALIDDYLKKGGDALFLTQDLFITDTENTTSTDNKGTTPSLNSILLDWGVKVGNDIVVDIASHVGGDEGSPATKNYFDHKSITGGLDYTFYVRPRSITPLAGRRSTIKLAPIVLTASKEQSWAETNKNLLIRYDEGEDTQGPIAIAYAVWDKKTDEGSSDTRIAVFTDADFLSNAYLNQYSNAALGSNVVNWLSELDYTPFLDQKYSKVERLNLTSKQTRMITGLLFLIPLFIFIFGIFIAIRR